MRFEVVTTFTAAGSRSGREWNRHTLPRIRGATGYFTHVACEAGVATLKSNTPFLDPATLTVDGVLTVTTSPGVKATLGRKLDPCPSECCITLPECGPLSEPTTLSGVTGIPRKEIWVSGDATSPPGMGNVCTVGVAAGDALPRARKIAAAAAGTRAAARETRLPAR